jgi:Fic family protein
MIHRHRKDYYVQLEAANKTLNIDAWLNWFADLVLAAQAHTLQGLDFLLANTRLWDRLRGQLNAAPGKGVLTDYARRSRWICRRPLGQQVHGTQGTRYWLTHAPNAIDDGNRTEEEDS